MPTRVVKKAPRVNPERSGREHGPFCLVPLGNSIVKKVCAQLTDEEVPVANGQRPSPENRPIEVTAHRAAHRSDQGVPQPESGTARTMRSCASLGRSPGLVQILQGTPLPNLSAQLLGHLAHQRQSPAQIGITARALVARLATTSWTRSLMGWPIWTELLQSRSSRASSPGQKGCQMMPSRPVRPPITTTRSPTCVCRRSARCRGSAIYECRSLSKTMASLTVGMPILLPESRCPDILCTASWVEHTVHIAWVHILRTENKTSVFAIGRAPTRMSRTTPPTPVFAPPKGSRLRDDYASRP